MFILLSMNHVWLFRTVLQNKPRNVVLCLMEVSRLASRFGLEPPGLVQMEKEIDAEEAKDRNDGPDDAKNAYSCAQDTVTNRNVRHRYVRLLWHCSDYTFRAINDWKLQWFALHQSFRYAVVTCPEIFKGKGREYTIMWRQIIRFNLLKTVWPISPR